jgi:hypothetical protein
MESQKPQYLDCQVQNVGKASDATCGAVKSLEIEGLDHYFIVGCVVTGNGRNLVEVV